MDQISTEQALQIPQQLKRHSSNSGTGGQTGTSTGAQSAPRSGSLGDDPVTIRMKQPAQQGKQVSVEDLKQALGQDNAFIKETLRRTLADFGLNPNTPVSIGKDLFGNLELKAPLLHSDLERLQQNLESSEEFMSAFGRVSQQKPTLDYVDNVVKLSNAYGVGNSLFNSIVSENNQYNGLTDIAHRYQALKSSADNGAGDPEASGSFRLTVN